MKSFKKLTGIIASMPQVNIDTDAIIPKQFLKTIERTGLGKHLFHEKRYDQNNNLNNIKEWVQSSHWIDFLAENPETISSTSICLKLVDPLIINKSFEIKNIVEKNGEEKSFLNFFSSEDNSDLIVNDVIVEKNKENRFIAEDKDKELNKNSFLLTQ